PRSILGGGGRMRQFTAANIKASCPSMLKAMASNDQRVWRLITTANDDQSMVCASGTGNSIGLRIEVTSAAPSLVIRRSQPAACANGLRRQHPICFVLNHKCYIISTIV